MALLRRLALRLAALEGLIAALPALLAFMLAATHDIRVPGVYMDAVNPDYLLIKAIHPSADLAVWMLPGMFPFNRLPILGQIYHGALPFYLGAPVYLAAGTGVVGIRLANMLFGLIVLGGAGFLLRAFRVPALVAGLALMALAVDPGFVFAWRTQFYITLLPTGLVFAAIALIETHRHAPTPRVAAAAGLLTALSVYGYFIHVFSVPAVLLFAAWRWRAVPLRVSRWMLAGLVVGGSPYVLGALLMIRAEHGLQGFFTFLAANATGLGVTSSNLSLVDRLHLGVAMLAQTVDGVGPATMLAGSAEPGMLGGVRLVLLILVPALGMMLALLRPARLPGLAVLLGIVLGYFALVLAFGNRLWLHHAIVLLPVLYLGLALTTGGVAQRTSRISAIMVLLSLLAANLVDRQRLQDRLDATGGVGLSSDAILRFAEASRADPAPTHAFFPDWGVFMSFEMITGGRIAVSTDFTPEAARHVLCSGQDVLLALSEIGADAARHQRLADWTAQIDRGPPEITLWRQRDGVPVLTAARWRATSSGCPAQ